MKRAILLAGIAALAITGYAAAQAPFTAPSVEYFMGPSLGQVWKPANSIIAGINNQTGTTYTISKLDNGKLVTFNNGSSIAVTLPQAGTPGFEAFTCFDVLNIGAGTATITPTTSTINGASSKAYAQNASARICSDGTNYWSF